MASDHNGPVVLCVFGSAPAGALAVLADREAALRRTDLVVVHIDDEPPGRLPGDRAACLVIVDEPPRGRAIGAGVGLALTTVRAPTLAWPRSSTARVPTEGPVLVGLTAPDEDGTLAFAFAEASLRGVAVHAIHTSGAGEPAGVEILDRWSEKYPAVPVSHRRMPGVDPGIALVAASHRAQLLIIGVSARPDAAPVSSGSLIHAVLRRSACPVVAVPDSSLG
jgi:nucleotide-binding universal stress UspA family protein